MAKLDTGAEYLPSLPEEFPASVLTEIERHYWTTFTAEQRELVSRAGYSLVDAIQRDASRPNYPKVRDRLEKLIKCLASARDATELRERLHEMLHTDGVGEALGSLLVFPAACQQPIGTLSPDAFERRRADLFAAANALLVLLRANYDDVRGPEPHAYIDLFITRLAEVYVPGRVTAGYNHALGAQEFAVHSFRARGGRPSAKVLRLERP